MKRVSHTLTYPGATVEEVFAMLGDADYRKAVGDYQHVQDFACEISPSGSGMLVRLEQAHGTDRIPSFARKLIGDEIRFVQDETWSSPAAARLQLVIPGKPGEMTGTAALTRSGDDVVERIDLEVKVSIPFVGGKVEDLIAGFVGKAFAAENKVGVKWLRGEWRS
jgi:hypothetical protein